MENYNLFLKLKGKIVG